MEFLDIEAGVKKVVDDEDDDFDYIYHLPHADLERLGPVRDPFAKKDLSSKKIDDRYISTSGLSVSSRLSAMSTRSISKREVRQMLGNQRENNALYTNLVSAKIMGSRMELGGDLAPEGGYNLSRRGSTASQLAMPSIPQMNRRGSNASQIGMPNMSQINRRGSNASQLPPQGLTAHGLAAPGGPRMGRRASAMGGASLGVAPPQRRPSAFGPAAFHVGKVAPEADEGNMSVNLLVRSGDDDDEELDKSWKALPKWWTDIVPNRITASVSLFVLTSLTIYVLVDSIILTVNG